MSGQQTNRKIDQLPRYAPKYQEKELNLLLRFLASIYTEWDMAEERLKLMAGKDQFKPPYAGMIAYYRHAKAGCLYMSKRASQGQRHLLEIDEERIKEILCEMARHMPT